MTIIATVRMVRIFRIFHVTQHYQTMQIITSALTESYRELGLLLILLLSASVFYASLIFYVEIQVCAYSLHMLVLLENRNVVLGLSISEPCLHAKYFRMTNVQCKYDCSEYVPKMLTSLPTIYPLKMPVIADHSLQSH